MKPGSKQELLTAVQNIPDQAFDKIRKITVTMDEIQIEVTYDPPILQAGGIGAEASYGYSRGLKDEPKLP